MGIPTNSERFRQHTELSMLEVVRSSQKLLRIMTCSGFSGILLAQNMNLTKCPQCQNSINESTNRLIQDACGHKKCRICLLKDEAKCETCRIENTSVNIVENNANKNYAEPNVIEKTENIKNNSSTSKSFSGIDHILVISRSPLLFKCTLCSKTFSTYANKKYHAYCGGIEKPLKCNYCDKRFISQSHLETHELKHSGIRPFACSICKANFIQRSKLNRHMKIHTGDRPFVCSECGKRFSNKDALTGHHRIHSGDKPYSCKKCESTFNNKSNLSKHLSTHAKDKIFMCEECSKKFANKWSLVSHRKCHSQERPHTCQHCKKAFTTIKDLRRHEVIHLDIKPYECNICKTKFCRKDNLERHLKNTHCINCVSEIKSASTKIIISRKQEYEHTNINETDVSKCNLSFKSSDGDVFVENPNAITVIKTCSLTQENSMANAVSVINGPFKLAFKTDAFKNNYNILKKDYKEPAPRIQTKKPYDMVESLNICQKILSPMHNTNQKNETADNSKSVIDNKSKNVIMSVGKVNEKDSLEICKKILTSMEVPPLHYETSFEEKKHALIKNIKFKLPSTYTNITEKLPENSMDNIAAKGMMQSNEITEEISNSQQMTNVNDDIKSSAPKLIDLQPPKLNCSEENLHSCDITNIPCTQSVIVNPQACDVSQKLYEKCWRKQNSQNLNVEAKNNL